MNHDNNQDRREAPTDTNGMETGGRGASAPAAPNPAPERRDPPGAPGQDGGRPSRRDGAPPPDGGHPPQGPGPEGGRPTFAAELARHLAHALRETGQSLSALARTLPIGYSTLCGWRDGKRHPLKSSIPQVEALEAGLGIEKGALSGLVSVWPTRLKTKLTPQGEHLAACLTDSYLHKHRDWSPAARAEWESLRAHKTQSPLTGAEPVEGQTYWSEQDGHCPSARKVLVDLECYYGWLIRERRLAPEDMSLALLADAELLRGYCDFRRMRSYGQCVTHQVPAFLALAGGLARAETGLLWREPERFGRHRHFAGRLPLSAPAPAGGRVRLSGIPERWRAHLHELRTRIRLELRRLRQVNAVRRSRPRDQYVGRILDHPSPWSVLFLCEGRMLSDPIPPSYSPRHRAIRAQVRLIFRLLVRYAFRRNTLAAILLSDIDLDPGRLTLPKERFKNRRYLDLDWRTTLEPSLLADVREFIGIHRPVLLAGRASPRLLVCSGEDKTANLLQIISNSCAMITNRYIPEWTPGFRPHSVRHIVATHIITRDPLHGIEQAAVALWDSVETVEREYAELRTVLFQVYHEELADRAQRESAGIAEAAARGAGDLGPAPPPPALARPSAPQRRRTRR